MKNEVMSSKLFHIERISAAVSKHGLHSASTKEVSANIKDIANFLNLTENQTILFSSILVLSLQRSVILDNLSKHLKCSTIEIIDMISEFDNLRSKSLIIRSNRARGKRCSYTDFGYIVPFNVIEALRTSDQKWLKEKIKFNLPNFLTKISDLVREREETSTSTKDLLSQVEYLISNNLEHTYVKYINGKVSETVNKCLVLVLSYLRLVKGSDIRTEKITQSLFDDLSDQLEYDQKIATGRNELFKTDVVCFQESLFADEKVVALTPKTLEKLYKDYPELNIKNESEDSLIAPLSVKFKNLYFEDRLQTQLDNITRVLDKKHFAVFQKKLEMKKLPKGISIIFYGKPGTGKTETVYQIAKKTGREILLVDLSKLKSKWFGDTEKQVKRVFDDYRNYCGTCIKKPILFINEADGMFTKRLTLKGKNSSVDQTVNTVQNIILQELETFEGILFATTNMTVNLDNAFERRFLFKIEFPNPSPEASRMIWESRMPELSADERSYLSTKYILSGGEIENITRKYLMESVISEKPSDFSKLLEFCEAEKPFQRQNRIGFQKNN
jgi:hypothetical protein